ncbi:unnamed protein product [Diplocarpon coronariae]
MGRRDPAPPIEGNLLSGYVLFLACGNRWARSVNKQTNKQASRPRLSCTARCHGCGGKRLEAQVIDFRIIQTAGEGCSAGMGTLAMWIVKTLCRG